jgi:hypothetical protein
LQRDGVPNRPNADQGRSGKNDKRERDEWSSPAPARFRDHDVRLDVWRTGAGRTASALSGQRRRLAFLALLASAGDRGLASDQLLGYLWADSSPEAARHSLEQMLYALRRALGDGVFVGGNPIRLNGEVVQSDLAEFEEAISRGQSPRRSHRIADRF